MPVGIDCGGRKIAIVCIEDNVYDVLEVKKIDYEVFYRKAGPFIESTMRKIHDDKWFMESPIIAGARNIQSTLRIAQTTGIVLAHVENVQPVAVSSWKKAVVGKGNANKDQVRAWLNVNHPDVARLCWGNQDLYDAACISLYGSRLEQDSH